MIAVAKPAVRRPVPDWHAKFLAMVPAIRAHARVSFRGQAPAVREDLIQDVIANCLVAFARLVELGKADMASPRVLARYAVAQTRLGRQVGSSLNVNDVCSRYAQVRKGIVVERLDEQEGHDGSWKEILVEDRHASPADTAACRIDFQDWLGRLSKKERRIALQLATGEKASRVARRFHLTEGRISQIRRNLRASWNQLQGQLPHGGM